MNPIPTNIITGFLGVGKTTLIQHLLSEKPAQESWAVLVNEFGEVGIDGALLREQKGRGGGAVVKEIPGGCMCCVAGLPMQVGLTQLLRSRQFDRLIIEPTGLGHPLEVLQTLSESFADTLEIKACLTLIDPRHFISERHLQNDTFMQQLQVADVLVVNKTDLAEPAELNAMQAYLQAQELDQRPRVEIKLGQLDSAWLELPHKTQLALPETVHHHGSNFPAANLPTPTAQQPITRKQHQGQGYYSAGWVFHPAKVFALTPLFNWLHGLECDRLKAVLITDQGIIALNLADGVVKTLELDECEDSRLEIIHHQPLDWQSLEQQLKQHLLQN
ncbi:GTP-binding protein [Gilvimarinus sp. DA14]|uniref:CobW family GTP-binding protein n=1 Tax=Gilvimarinus sp. DA14 TaxID=2956798 RepID=UPI0020B6544F|nr:GTP-binding protein [Gilvimarinus sp. DA14]UTF61802.1 GTP-binding protein [Gilvimarinus sp. DA14]